MIAPLSIKQTKLKVNIVPYLFLIVPMLLFLIWVIGPMIYTFYLSFTNWDGVSAAQFVGIKNYVLLFKDPIFRIALVNNMKWLVSLITVPVVLGLALAMALNSNIPGARIFKTAVFMPYVLSFVIAGMIFGWMYHPAGGLLNSTLHAMGLDFMTAGWLSDPKLATWCIIVAAIWRQVGYIMILYLAGLQSVDPTLIDAARVDGCNSWQLFRRVIFPLLGPVTVIIMTISIIDSLRSFDLVFVMTRGGPANSSSVLANFMYIESFNNYKMGYGAAISVILFLISAVFIFIYLRRMLRTELEY
jgi:ABC-type sugar transport system permease subunit